MKKLVIAEKPSQARKYADALGAAKSGSVFESDEWIIVNARGHLVDLLPPDKYDGKPWGKPWTIEALPMLPSPCALGIEDGDARALFDNIKKQIERADVCSIVCATDPEREGEGIFRRIVEFAGSEKQTLRMWSDSETSDALAAAFENLRDDSDFDGYADAAWARACADWYVGMNLTRAASVTYRTSFRIGRVMSCVLALISERTKANRTFESVPFFTVKAKAECGFEMETERYDDRTQAEAALASCDGKPIAIESVEKKERRVKPPELFDLTSLQREASKRFGLSAQKTLETCQALYEAGLATYPRTDSRYVTEADRGLIEALLRSEEIEAIVGCSAVGASVDAVLSDKDVMGHGALLPTDKLTSSAFAKLDDRQQKVMRLICARLFCATGATGTDLVSKVAGNVDGIRFASTTTQEIEAGWRIYEQTILGAKQNAAQALPDSITEGALLEVADYLLHEGKTKPPDLYTDATLLAVMANPSKLIDDKELASAVMDGSAHPAGIGTPATRASIIEKLVSAGYVERTGKGGKLASTSLGDDCCKVTPERLKDAVYTASWEERLRKILKQEEGAEAFLGDIRAEVRDLVKEIVENPIADIKATARVSYGKCPRCGMDVVKSKSGAQYRCSSIKFGKSPDSGEWEVVDAGCGFKLMSKICGKRLSDKAVSDILAGKKVHARGLISKSGKQFSADIALDSESDFGTKLLFEDRQRPKRRSAGGRHG